MAASQCIQISMEHKNSSRYTWSRVIQCFSSERHRKLRSQDFWSSCSKSSNEKKIGLEIISTLLYDSLVLKSFYKNTHFLNTLFVWIHVGDEVDIQQILQDNYLNQKEIINVRSTVRKDCLGALKLLSTWLIRMQIDNFLAGSSHLLAVREGPIAPEITIF